MTTGATSEVERSSLSGRMQFSREKLGVWIQDGPKPSQCIAQSKKPEADICLLTNVPRQVANALKVDQSL